METDAALGRDFFPRAAITDVLEKRLAAFRSDYRQNVGLVGKKFLGKTSILKDFILTRPVDGIVPVYVEIGQEAVESCVYKWMGAVLYGMLRTRREDVPLSRSAMIRRARAFAPETVRHMQTVRRYLRRGAFESAFREVVCISGTVSEETKRKVVLVIDEFHRLEHFGPKDMFRVLGREIMTQKDTLYIMASSEPEAARHIFGEQLALLFGNFEVLELAPLDFSECQAFIRHRLGRHDLRKSLEQFLLHITDGNPYYLDVLLQRMRLIGKDRWIWRLNEAVLTDALTEELFYRSGLIHLRFSGMMKGLAKGRASSALIQVLCAIALGRRKVRKITQFTMRPMGEVRKALGRLLDDGYVTQQGTLYTISDALLAFWLVEVYKRQEEFLGLEKSHLADVFRTRMHELIRYFDAVDREELSTHVVKIFKKFQNDVISLGGKRVKCPKFSRVHTRLSNGRVFPVYAEGHAGRWMAQVVNERLTEDDVERFMADEEGLPQKAGHRIMITLKGAEQNAKLMAITHGLTLWNLRQLNQLAKLYDQPKVIM